MVNTTFPAMDEVIWVRPMVEFVYQVYRSTAVADLISIPVL